MRGGGRVETFLREKDYEKEQLISLCILMRR
jgi:hypothetical protein